MQTMTLHVDDTNAPIDDPLWAYVLESRLRLYIPAVRKWWGELGNVSFKTTGLTELDADVPGLFIKFTRSPIRSAIRGVQAYPFVPTTRLQISGVRGGITKMISTLCMDGKLEIDEFTIICKDNMPSTFNNTQILAFIPTELLERTKERLGLWIYFTPEEIALLAAGETNDAIKLKALLKA